MVRERLQEVQRRLRPLLRPQLGDFIAGFLTVLAVALIAVVAFLALLGFGMLLTR